MNIGVAAASSGVSAKMIRHGQATGLLRPPPPGERTLIANMARTTCAARGRPCAVRSIPATATTARIARSSLISALMASLRVRAELRPERNRATRLRFLLRLTGGL